MSKGARVGSKGAPLSQEQRPALQRGPWPSRLAVAADSWGTGLCGSPHSLIMTGPFVTHNPEKEKSQLKIRRKERGAMSLPRLVTRRPRKRPPEPLLGR